MNQEVVTEPRVVGDWREEVSTAKLEQLPPGEPAHILPLQHHQPNPHSTQIMSKNPFRERLSTLVGSSKCCNLVFASSMLNPG